MSFYDECVEIASEQAWFVVKDSSKISLTHNKNNNLILDLNLLPFPFHLNSALTDLLFVLPTTPTAPEWETVLHLASTLGNSASGKTVLPAAMLGPEAVMDRSD